MKKSYKPFMLRLTPSQLKKFKREMTKLRRMFAKRWRDAKRFERTSRKAVVRNIKEGGE